MIAIAWACARKDLTLYLRDRTALLLSIALPILLATIFGFAMGGMGGDDSIGRVRILVQDLDGSEGSRALLRELEGMRGLRVKPAEDVRAAIADGDAPAGLVIGAGYAEDLAAGRRPSLKLYRDPGQEIEQQIIAGNLLPALFRAGGSRLSRDAVKGGMRELGLDVGAIPGFDESFESMWNAVASAAEDAEARDAANSTGSPTTDAPAPQSKPASDGPNFDFGKRLPMLLGLSVEDVVGGGEGGKKLAGQAHAVSGIAVMMLLFGVAAAAGTILEEQQNGTLTRLLLTPSPAFALLLGKSLMIFLSGLLQIGILMVYGALIFDVPVWRAPAAVLAVSLALCAATTGFGLLLGVLFHSRKQLEGISTLLILAMSALGGSWFPLVITPEWYQRLGHFTINAWAMDGYQAIFWYGKGLEGVGLPVLVLSSAAVILWAAAAWQWKRRFETLA